MRLSLRPRPAALLLTATLTLALSPALSPALPAAADPTWTSVGHGGTVTVRGVPGDGQHTFIPTADRSDRKLTSSGLRKGRASRPYALSPTPLSDIVVNYDPSFDPAAMPAFDAAVAIWERAVYSAIPIEVDASMAALEPGVLGFAGPIDFFNGGGVLYPVALANSLDASDLNGTGTSEIDAQFTTNSSFFYFGTDGNTPLDKYDFESVVLHEIGHGLGFIGSVEQGLGEPQAHYNDPPLVYDLFTETSDGAAILDYPNNSQELTDAVTSEALYWAGPHGAGADRGRMPRLDAPSTGFESGSSYSHLSDVSYPENDADALMTPSVGTGDAIHDPGEILLGMFRDMGWVTPGLPGSTYTPIQPVRLLDTGTRLGAGATRDIAVTGANGVPTNATAVVVNLTSAVPTGSNVLRSYALPRATSGAPIPTVSNLNTAKGDTRANLAVVPIGRSGRIRVLNTGSATRLVVDLAGYYAPAATSYFHPRTPVRVMDTRNGTGPVPVAPVGAGQFVELSVAGLNSVPPTGATAVVLTLTAVAPTNNTYVTAFPADGVAGTSNLNVNRNATVANQVVVKLSADGKVRFRNNAGSTHLLADLTGWFDTDTGGALFRPALTQRLKDSRPGRLGPGALSDVGVSELADAFWGVPDTATAAIVNLTGVGASTHTYLQLYPAGTSVPTVSNLNLAPGQTAAASATVLLGAGLDAGEIRVRNNAGTVPFIVDLQGWYGPA